MPSRPLVDYDKMVERFRQFLRKGATNSADACRFLGISQPTFSRILTRNKRDFLSFGRASKTQYALRREVPNVGHTILVHQINEAGAASKLGCLHGIEPNNGFYFESAHPDNFPSRLFEDLPYFLNDLRPAGFLGRLIPPRYPDLEAPKDITKWSPNHCLQYLTRHGSDLIGNLILGEGAYKNYLRRTSLEGFLDPPDRRTEYPKMASAVLEHGDPGSSAGGEQPKFSAVVGDARTPVLVKFSPKTDTAVGCRIADLLICEDISLRALRAAGREASCSEIVCGNDQIFLEVKRFDRVGRNGRRGLISLETLDAEFAGRGTTWAERSQGLLAAGIINRVDCDEVRWRELYGHLIGNSDMHAANISFFIEWPKTVSVAPIYDMLPMLYMPKNDQLVDREFIPPLPSPRDADIWLKVWHAAREFWRIAGEDDRISPAFRSMARDNLEKLLAQEYLGSLLPRE